MLSSSNGCLDSDLSSLTLPLQDPYRYEVLFFFQVASASYHHYHHLSKIPVLICIFFMEQSGKARKPRATYTYGSHSNASLSHPIIISLWGLSVKHTSWCHGQLGTRNRTLFLRNWCAFSLFFSPPYSFLSNPFKTDSQKFTQTG